tara:strand:+ start:3798 stop:4676 length:879 start_codon:yes stop_codon:yes gene_type:complete
MAVEIKGGGSTDLAGVFPVGKGLRVTNVSSEGIEGFQSLPIAIALTDVTALNDDLLSSLDVSQYKFISLQLTGNWVGTVSFQGSNDGGTFYPIVTSNPSGGLANGETSTTVNRLVKVPTVYRFVRIRVTAYTSGIVEGVAFGHRDENSSGLISAIGPVTLNAETTKKIGNVGIVTDAETLLKDYYVGAVGAVNVNSRVLRAQASSLKSIVMTNLAATPRYVKIYDLASTPVAGSGTPVIVIALPVAATIAFPLPSDGLAFENGIAMTMTLGPANDNVTGTSTIDFVLMSIFT